MSEKNLSINLGELITTYAENKSQLDSYKKVCDKQNSEIKSTMNEMEIDVFDTGQYTAKVSISTKESMDEDKLISVIKSDGCDALKQCIKTKEYVDMEELEKAIYNGDVPSNTLAEMGKCKSVKEVSTLRISKNKKKKGE